MYYKQRKKGWNKTISLHHFKSMPPFLVYPPPPSPHAPHPLFQTNFFHPLNYPFMSDFRGASPPLIRGFSLLHVSICLSSDKEKQLFFFKLKFHFVLLIIFSQITVTLNCYSVMVSSWCHLTSLVPKWKHTPSLWWPSTWEIVTGFSPHSKCEMGQKSWHHLALICEANWRSGSCLMQFLLEGRSEQTVILHLCESGEYTYSLVF